MTQEDLSESKLALIIIDMQYNITAQGHGVLKYAKELGVREGYDYYYDRIQNRIIPNIRKLLKYLRGTEIPIIFTKIRSHSFSDGDTKTDPEDPDAEGVILKEINPMNDEVVITKDDPDMFEGTGLDSLLRENGINTLMIAGVLTNECVEASVLRAIKKDYRVILLEDSTAAFSESIHEIALELIRDNKVIITSTENILDLL
ncbi:MAG: cysteine hydrolase [Thermoplasmata archaeon]